MVPLARSCRTKQEFWETHSSSSHGSPGGSICLQSVPWNRAGWLFRQRCTHARLGSQPQQVIGSGRGLMGH